MSADSSVLRGRVRFILRPGLSSSVVAKEMAAAAAAGSEDFGSERLTGTRHCVWMAGDSSLMLGLESQRSHVDGEKFSLGP